MEGGDYSMRKNLDLKGRIHSKYNSEAEFARAIGWSRQRLSKITNGHRVPTLFEVDDLAAKLECSFMDIANFYLLK